MSVFAHKNDKSKFNLGNESDLTGIGDGTPFNAIKAVSEGRILGSVNPTSTMTRAQLVTNLWNIIKNLPLTERCKCRIVRNDGMTFQCYHDGQFATVSVGSQHGTYGCITIWQLRCKDGIYDGTSINGYLDLSAQTDVAGRIHYVVI